MSERKLRQFIRQIIQEATGDFGDFKQITDLKNHPILAFLQTGTAMGGTTRAAAAATKWFDDLLDKLNATLFRVTGMPGRPIHMYKAYHYQNNVQLFVSTTSFQVTIDYGFDTTLSITASKRDWPTVSFELDEGGTSRDLGNKTLSMASDMVDLVVYLASLDEFSVRNIDIHRI